MRNGRVFIVLCTVVMFLALSTNYCAAIKRAPVSDIAITYADASGKALSKATDGYFAVVGHTLRPSAVIRPQNAPQSLIWRVSSAKIASVDSRGVVRCKKPGVVTVSATARYGNAGRDIRIYVLPNESRPIATMPAPGLVTIDAIRIYIAKGRLTIDMRVHNATDRPLRALGTQAVYLSYNASSVGRDAYVLVDRVPVKLGKPVQPGQYRVVTVRLGKVDRATVDLTHANAFMEGSARFG